MLADIEPEITFAAIRIRPVTLKTVLGKDGTDVAIEAELRRRAGRVCSGHTHESNAKYHAPPAPDADVKIGVERESHSSQQSHRARKRKPEFQWNGFFGEAVQPQPSAAGLRLPGLVGVEPAGRNACHHAFKPRSRNTQACD